MATTTISATTSYPSATTPTGMTKSGTQFFLTGANNISVNNGANITAERTIFEINANSNLFTFPANSTGVVRLGLCENETKARAGTERPIVREGCMIIHTGGGTPSIIAGNNTGNATAEFAMYGGEFRSNSNGDIRSYNNTRVVLLGVDVSNVELWSVPHAILVGCFFHDSDWVLSDVGSSSLVWGFNTAKRVVNMYLVVGAANYTFQESDTEITTTGSQFVTQGYTGTADWVNCIFRSLGTDPYKIGGYGTDSMAGLWRHRRTVDVKLSKAGVSLANAKTRIVGADTSIITGDKIQTLTYRSIDKRGASTASANLVWDNTPNYTLLARELTCMEETKTLALADGNGNVVVNFYLNADNYYTNNESDNLSQVTITSVSGAITSIAIEQEMTLDKLYDIIKAYLVANMDITNLLFASGTLLDISSCSITNAEKLSTGTKIKSLKTKGTITGASEINITYVDSTGVVVNVSNLNPNNFTYNNQFIHVLYKKSTETVWTRLSSQTATSLKFKAIASTDYNVRVRVAGYVWKTFDINSGTSSVTIDAALVADTDLGGNTLYTSSQIVQSQVDAISYSSSNNRVEVRNTGTTELSISFNSAYKKMQDILHLSTLVGVWENQFQVNPQKNGFEFPSGNVTNVYLSSDSTFNVYFAFTLKNQIDSSDARERIHGNASGYFIAFPNSINNLSIPFPSASDVRTEIEKTEVLAKKSDVPTKEAIATQVESQIIDEADGKAVLEAIKNKIANENITVSAIQDGLAKANELKKVTDLLTADNTKFTATALSNAPTGSGSSGAGLTTDQASQLQQTYRSLVATSYNLTSALANGATEIPIASTFSDGYFTGHYVVINDGAGNVVQRLITSHINTTGSMMLPPNMRKSVLQIDAIGAVANGSTVMIQVRTATQDGGLTDEQIQAITDIKAKTDAISIDADGFVQAIVEKTGYTLTEAERTAIATEVEKAMLNETDGKAILQAIKDKIGSENVSASTIVDAIKESSIGKDLNLIKTLKLTE